MFLENIAPAVLSTYDDITQVGQGLTSTVYSAMHKLTNKKVAIKQISRSNLMNQKSRLAFENELKILEACDHPFISLFYELIDTPDFFYIIMEFATGGTLTAYLRSNGGPLPEDECQKLFCQLLSTVTYLHESLNIIHRDLKLDNIMLDEYRNIRLIDFGLAKINSSNFQIAKTQCGTFPYTAPEILKNVEYTKKVDIWSLGIVLYILAVGAAPFASTNPSVLINQILNDEIPLPNSLSPDLRDLLAKILVKNPEERIEIEEIVQHRWVSSSAYKFIVDPDFLRNPDLSINCMTDPLITAKLVRYKLDPARCNQFGTVESTFYRIFRKNKISNLLKSMKKPKKNFFTVNAVTAPSKSVISNSTIDLKTAQIRSMRASGFSITSGINPKIVVRRIKYSNNSSNSNNSKNSHNTININSNKNNNINANNINTNNINTNNISNNLNNNNINNNNINNNDNNNIDNKNDNNNENNSNSNNNDNNRNTNNNSSIIKDNDSNNNNSNSNDNNTSGNNVRFINDNNDNSNNSNSNCPSIKFGDLSIDQTTQESQLSAHFGNGSYIPVIGKIGSSNSILTDPHLPRPNIIKPRSLMKNKPFSANLEKKNCAVVRHGGADD